MGISEKMEVADSGCWLYGGFWKARAKVWFESWLPLKAVWCPSEFHFTLPPSKINSTHLQLMPITLRFHVSKLLPSSSQQASLTPSVGLLVANGATC